MTVGPIDIVVIGFPGNKFTGRIAPAVTELARSGTVRVVDLLFVSRSEDGDVSTIDPSDLTPEAAGDAAIDVAQPGSLELDDVAEIAEDLSPGESALIIAFENVWAASLIDACRAADAVVLNHVRVPIEMSEAILGEVPPSPEPQSG